MRYRTSAVAAALAATVTTVTIGVTSQSGAAAPKDHVTKVVVQGTGSHEYKHGGFSGTSELRTDGKVVGFESYAGRYRPKKGYTVIRVAIALRGGVILGKVVGRSDQSGKEFVYRGRIQAGDGRFAGVAGGVVRVESLAGTRMTVRWHIAD